MKIRVSLALLSLAGLASITSAYAPAPVYREPPKPKTPPLFAQLQGTWEIQQNVNNRVLGRGLAVKRVQQKIRIHGTTWGYVFENNGILTESTRYEMELDPKAIPATLDLVQNQNVVFGGLGNVAPVQQGKQVAMKGIVKVEGDTLTFCYSYGFQANAERPRQFFTGNQIMANGTTAMTMTLKRVR